MSFDELTDKVWAFSGLPRIAQEQIAQEPIGYYKKELDKKVTGRDSSNISESN